MTVLLNAGAEGVWNIEPGDQIVRRELHDRFGGSRQGGISPSTTSPNVLLFADPDVGPGHGYVDGWKSDGRFHYTGSGQRGDQDLGRLNGAVLGHAQSGKTLRLFRGSAGIVQYAGAFALDNQQPYYRTDAPETGGGPTRSVIVFRLRPIGGTATSDSVEPPLADSDEVDDVPFEAQNTERYVVNPTLEPTEAERREAALVTTFVAWLEKHGHAAIRRRIRPKGEAKPLYTDVFSESLNLLVEAKGSVERGAFRMALGQLADYRRFLASPRCAILLPSKPSSDLLRLAQCEGVLVFWRAGSDFVGTGKITA